MRNFTQPGDVLSLTAPYALTAGQGAQVGSIFGVAIAAAAISTAVELATRGTFTLTKQTGQAWAQGQALYWDNTNRQVTTTVGTNKLIGYAVAAAASGDAVGSVWVPGL